MGHWFFVGVQGHLSQIKFSTSYNNEKGEVFTKSHMVYSQRTSNRLTKLGQMLTGKGSMLIVMQDSPDPDAIASAVALRVLANACCEVACSLVYAGPIGRAENRALVAYLKLKPRSPEQIDPRKFDLIAMVDTQPGTGNNCLPADILPDIVIDHHPVKPLTRSVKFTDVRSNYGSTSTILLEYFIGWGLLPSVPVATALMYGIRSDTLDLGREATKADINAIEVLYPLANKRMLGQIQRGRVPDDYFKMLSYALADAMVYGNMIVACLGEVDNPDIMGELADLLLRHEGCGWTLCFGFFESRVILSIRTGANSNRADLVMREVVSGMGTGGGHAGMAGGQIPITEDSPEALEKLVKKIKQRFIKAVGPSGTRGRRLIA